MRPAGVVALALLLLPAAAEARPRCHLGQKLLLRDVAMGSGSLRPDAVGWVDSDRYPLRVHYRRAEDATKAAEVVLPAAELAWQVQVEEMGWPAPPADDGDGGDDRYDLYLTNEDTQGGAWTWGTGPDTTQDDGFYSLASFIALDDRYISDADLPDFVIHEFNHAVQYTVDGWETPLFVWEMTANAMEELVLPDSDLYMVDIPDFQELPFASLLHDGYSDAVMEYDDWSYYEYGGSVFGLYLEERWGQRDGAVLLRLWEGLAQGSRAPEPDFVDAMDGLVAERPSAAELYLDFAEWRLFAGTWDDGAHFEEGADWGNDARPAREPELAGAALDGLSVQPVDAPYDLGVTYFPVALDGLTAERFTARVEGDPDARWGVVAVVWPAEGAATVTRAMGAEGDPVEVDLDLAGARRVVVGVVNGGPETLDAEDDVPRRDFTLSFTATPTDPSDDDPDADPPTDREAPAACGCATGGSAGAPALAGLALLALARRRRR